MDKNTKIWTGWCVSAPWYDKMKPPFPPFTGHTKRRVIKEAVETLGSWPKAKRQGWYVTKFVMRWPVP